MYSNSSQFIATILDANFEINKKKIYAGQWCFSSREKTKNFLKNKDLHLISNPWKNIDLLEKDYIYMQKLLDIYAKKLSIFLNVYHKKNFPERYWNILTLSWLYYYIPSQLYRWKVVNEALNFNKNLDFCLLNDDKESSPSYTIDYLNLIRDNNEFNYTVFKKILKFLKNNGKNINFLKKDFKFKEEKKINLSISQKIKFNFYTLLDNFNLIMAKKNLIFIEDKIFTKKNFYKINLKLGQFPQHFRSLFNYHFENYHFENINYDFKSRESLQFDEAASYDDLDMFPKFLDTVIKFDIPKCFLEGYNMLNNSVKNIKIRPKLIVSSYNHYHNEKFKYWVASNVIENQAKFYVSNHGGANHQKFSPCLQYENKFVDKKFTWTKPRNNNDVQLPASKFINYNFNRKNPIYLSYVEEPNHLYPHKAGTGVNFSTSNNIENIILFKSILKKDIFQKLKYLPTKESLISEQRDLKKEIKDKYINESPALYKYISKSKIIVCSYPQTAFLEGILTGPTVLINDPKNNPFLDQTEETKQLQIKLFKNKICFKDAKEAAEHINEVWSNPLSWWNSPNVLNTINELKDNFCKISNNGINEWTNFLEDEI